MNDVILFCCGVIAIIFAFVRSIMDILDDQNWTLTILSFVVNASGMILGIMLLYGSINFYSTPMAIDVYRGKTELKITEVKEGGVIVSNDTTVIFKKEFRKKK